ncbi:MAG TPA: hypothetical protein VL854_14490, partial [Nitrososphaeraceae archaeon]|nr:hypothetical protein [Nitrososphaeraceae archaeon]
DEIRNLWVGLDLKEIEFHVQVIDDSPRAEYRIRKDIISLFERLKCGIIFQESQSGIELQSSILIEPSRSIYMAVLDLATLWSEVRGAKAIGAEDLLRRLKLILDQLDISKEFIDERNDYVRPSSESYFIARDIYKIYLQLFEFAKKELPTSSLKQFLVYWIKLYKGDDGYKHHSSGLKIAQYLAEVVPEAKADLLEVIKHAESLARQEEETSMLFEYLLEVALTYKQCEYSDDFKRVYSSILNVTFGLHWKKDYRSASIAYPMKLMHSVDPGNSLERIAEVFQSQRQLINAGRSRMYHISVSQIIAHVAEINPDLAFHLLEHEEEDLHRPETMYYVLKSMIQVAIPEHLPLIWCILNTMQRWEKDEDNYPELCNLLLAKTLLCKNLTLASRISEDLKTYALVDRDLPEQISKSARFLKGMGFDANKVGLTMDNESSQSPEVPEAVSDPDVLQIEQVASLLTHNKADDFMGTLFHRMTISKRIETLKHEYHTFRRHVIGYYDSLNTDDKK